MAILPFRKQKMSTNGIKPPLTQEELERGKQLQKALKNQLKIQLSTRVFLKMDSCTLQVVSFHGPMPWVMLTTLPLAMTKNQIL